MGFTSTKLWIAFSKLEGLMDAYVPAKRNEVGKRFGFLRFKNVRNEEGLKQKLNNTWVEGCRISANISKYSRPARTEFVRKEQREDNAKKPYFESRSTGFKPNFNSYWKDNKTFSEVVRGTKESHESWNTPKINLGSRNITGLANLAQRAVMGEVKNVELMSRITELIQQGVESNCVIRYLGGLRILISFENHEAANVYIKNKKDGWEKYLTSAKIWNGIDTSYQRIAWIKIRGIPIQVWSSKTSDQIGGHFGKVVSGSMADENDGDLSEDRIAVATEKLDTIKTKICLIHQGSSFEIAVEEEEKGWKPEFMKVVLTANKADEGCPESNRNPTDNTPAKMEASGSRKRKSQKRMGKRNVGNETFEELEAQAETSKNNFGSGGPTEDTGTKSCREEFNQNVKLMDPNELGPTQKVSSPNVQNNFVSPNKVGPSQLDHMESSPTSLNKSLGCNKRKRTRKSAETSSGGKSSSQRKAKRMVRKRKIEFIKKAKKKGTTRINDADLEEEISNWANEDPTQSDKEEEWYEVPVSSVNSVEEVIEQEKVNGTQLTDEEIVKESLDTINMGEELGINLKGMVDKVGESILEQEKNKVYQ